MEFSAPTVFTTFSQKHMFLNRNNIDVLQPRTMIVQAQKVTAFNKCLRPLFLFISPSLTVAILFVTPKPWTEVFIAAENTYFCDLSVRLTLNKRMLVTGYYIFIAESRCSISNESRLKENSNSLHCVCIEYASKQRSSNQNTISTCVIFCTESYEKFKSIYIFTKHAGKYIPHSSNSEKKRLLCKSTEKDIQLTRSHE